MAIANASEAESPAGHYHVLRNIVNTEMYVIIIAGSLPTLRPLFQKTISVYRSRKQRSSHGYHSYDHAPHEMQSYRKKKHTNNSILYAKNQDNERSSDSEILASNAEGITKTVDITFASSPGVEEGKKWERWEEQHFGERGTREYFCTLARATTCHDSCA
ncbi:MAG: hypothetical protein Q9192_003026 [Flavoplaca navasiana]